MCVYVCFFFFFGVCVCVCAKLHLRVYLMDLGTEKIGRRIHFTAFLLYNIICTSCIREKSQIHFCLLAVILPWYLV